VVVAGVCASAIDKRRRWWEWIIMLFQNYVFRWRIRFVELVHIVLFEFDGMLEPDAIGLALTSFESTAVSVMHVFEQLH